MEIDRNDAPTRVEHPVTISVLRVDIPARRVVIPARRVVIPAPRAVTPSRTQAALTRPRVDRLRRARMRRARMRRARMPGRPHPDRARGGRSGRDLEADPDRDRRPTARPGPTPPATIAHPAPGRRGDDPASRPARSTGLPSRPIGRSRSALQSVLAGLPAGALDRSTAGLAAARVPLVPASRAADP